MAPRDGRLVRPLLATTREQTAEYCRARGVEWREDESNDAEGYARARVRHRLVPALREIHPAAERNLLAVAQILRDEATVLDRLVAEVLEAEEQVSIARLRAMPEALARLVVQELAGEVSRDYQGKDLVLVGVLKGAVFFLSDLMRGLDIPCEVDFMAVASYGTATKSSGVVRILKDLDAVIEGRDVLIVEDIVDSGLTLQYLLRNLGARNPRSLEVCALLIKPERRKVDLRTRYVGFEIPNRFAIGYGLDC